MKIGFAWFAPLLLLTAPVLGDTTISMKSKDGTETKVLVPDDSPFRLDHIVREDGNDYQLVFVGKMLVHAKYEYGDSETNEGSGTFGETANIVLDGKTAARLPYFEGRRPMDEYGVGLEITNPRTLAQAVLPRSVLLHASRSGKSATGEAMIWIDKLTMSLDCDHVTYNAHFLAVQNLGIAMSHNDYVGVGC